MFCTNCGKALADDVIFCPSCGTKKVGSPNMVSAQDVEAGQNKKDSSAGAEMKDQKSGKKDSSRNIISRIWNSPIFTTVSIKFGNILEILVGIIFIILSILLFGERGFWGVAWGIFLIVSGLAGCINGIISLLSHKKNNDEGEVLDETAINKKKRHLCIGIVVLIIVLAVIISTGGGTYSIVKSISFDNIGEETIGEIVDGNIKSPEWSQKKLDSSSKLVYVEGYCPSYGETVRIEFYYEKKGDSHEVSLSGIYLPDSDEELSTFEAAFVWASFYN